MSQSLIPPPKINILERREAIVAMVARLLSVVIIAQRSSVIDLFGFVYKAFSQCSLSD